MRGLFSSRGVKSNHRSPQPHAPPTPKGGGHHLDLSVSPVPSQTETPSPQLARGRVSCWRYVVIIVVVIIARAGYDIRTVRKRTGIQYLRPIPVGRPIPFPRARRLSSENGSPPNMRISHASETGIRGLRDSDWPTTRFSGLSRSEERNSLFLRNTSTLGAGGRKGGFHLHSIHGRRPQCMHTVQYCKGQYATRSKNTTRSPSPVPTPESKSGIAVETFL